jgi:hypothetical protein
MVTDNNRSSIVRAVVVGGAVAGVLDAIDAVVAFKAVLGFDPIPIYQFVASGILGPRAFDGGVCTALFGLAIHFLIAFAAAFAFVLASTRTPYLARAYGIWGPLFGLVVWAVMNLVVIPLSRIPSSPFSLPLFLNGVIGHALLVGLPIAYATNRYFACHGSGRNMHSRESAQCPVDVQR